MKRVISFVTLLAGYSDRSAVAAYAVESVAACVKTGIVSGRSADTLAPKAPITRAEAAVIVRQLLERSGLIDAIESK